MSLVLTSAIASASLGHVRKVRELIESFDLVHESSSESKYWRRDEESAAVPRNFRSRRKWPQHLFVWYGCLRCPTPFNRLTLSQSLDMAAVPEVNDYSTISFDMAVMPDVTHQLPKWLFCRNGRSARNYPHNPTCRTFRCLLVLNVCSQSYELISIAIWL